MMRFSVHGMKGLLILGFVAGGLIGCGWSPTAPTDEDSEYAREVLIAALDAWRTGQATSLAKQTPPIRFADDDLKAGAQLMDYKLQNEPVRIIPFRDVQVELVLKSKQGQELRKVANYQVAIEATPSVMRSDN